MKQIWLAAALVTVFTLAGCEMRPNASPAPTPTPAASRRATGISPGRTIDFEKAEAMTREQLINVQRDGLDIGPGAENFLDGSHLFRSVPQNRPSLSNPINRAANGVKNAANDVVNGVRNTGERIGSGVANALR